MESSTLATYRRFRSAGYPAGRALRMARILAKWEAAESCGAVRICTYPDYDCTEDGPAVGVVGEYTLVDHPTESDWQHGDSVWGFAGYRDPLDPADNPYVPDIMAETLGAFRDARKAGVREREYVPTA